MELLSHVQIGNFHSICLKCRWLPNKFHEKNWALGILKGHKTQVALLLATNINKCRAVVSKESLQTYFTNLQDILKDLKPEKHLHYDESNVGNDLEKSHAIHRKECEITRKPF